jgi:hypothetical protein
MLKYDGTVDYYLDPNDYSKKLDGTASDVADPTYAGNAMMEWGRDGKIIWYKVVPDSDPTSYSVYIADNQVDDAYVCYPFVNGDGDINAIDAAQVLISSATVGTGGEPTIEVALGDIDSDGKADASDASKILIYSAEAGAGYEGSLPEYFNLVQ